MARLWAFLCVAFIGYGAWIVLALPREDAIVNAIPFVFWVLLFGWLARRASARNRRAEQSIRTNLYPGITKVVR